MDVNVRYQRDIYRLRGAELLEPEIDAGQPARIRLILVPFAGPEVSHIVSVRLPVHLGGTRVTLRISPGYLEVRDKANVENLSDLIHNLADGTYPPKSLVIAYEGGAAVTYRGHVARDLPPGALDVLQARTSSVAPAAMRSELRHVERLQKYVIGTDQVTVKVRPVLR